MSTAILPGKFDDGDFDAWLREFDACSTANGWKVTEASDAKILKLPAFLRGRAASNFYAIPEGERRTYADAVKAMRRALRPPAKRENFFAEFELRALRPDEDPSVYKWELENILSKADPTLSNDAKTALLTRQFSRGLPPTLKLKMLEHNPTPTLNEMVEFTQRFLALGQPVAAEIPPVQVDAVAHSSYPADSKLQELNYYHGCWHRGETTSAREPPETYGKHCTYSISSVDVWILLYVWFTRSSCSRLYATARLWSKADDHLL